LLGDLTPLLRRWRYQAVETVNISDLCEEVCQAVPLWLVTESWLFRASNQTGLLYIRKLKRLFDLVVASLFAVALSPILLVGMLLVKFNSPGPVFFRQTRLGRLGREFAIIKLRTMHLDAEKDGPQWSATDDPRVFAVGKWLRRFRVDEIPQLLNILRGEMSFVGPRPERPEFVERLKEVIPFYEERLSIQPGLTGWAQVRFPYGASEEDARRKHEFDLYYLKHMSVLLDFFVLLETVRTVVIGGVRRQMAQPDSMSQCSHLFVRDQNSLMDRHAMKTQAVDAALFAPFEAPTY
jgi:lipopolysaccharide/colanic/teichoic acid biosynthesis glycosyltransferase